MKNKFYYSIILVCLVLSYNACDKDSGPTAPVDIIPTNLFPFEVGREWVFDAIETDTAGNPIPGKTGKSRMKILMMMELVNRQAYMLVDTTTIADTSTIEVNLFSVDEKGNLWQYFFSTHDQPEFVKSISDLSILSGGIWLKVFNRELGINQVHTVLDSTLQVGPAPVQFKILSVIKNRTSLTVPIGHFNEVYPGEIEFQITAGNILTKYKFNIWLVPDVGFIKFRQPVTIDFGYSVQGYIIKELKSKNF